MRIIHLADLHLNGGEESFYCFEQAIDHAITHKADLILCAGDVYDNRTPPPEYKSLFHRMIKRVSDNNIPCFIIVGNHDKSPSQVKVHALDELGIIPLAGVQVFNEFTICNFNGVEIVLIPWLYTSDLPVLPPKNGRRIGCVHASIAGCVGIGDRPIHFGEREFIISPAYFSDFDYVAMGHIHRPQTINNIVYPGSAGILNWGEANDPPHGFVEVNVGDTVTWQHHPYHLKHKWVDVEVTGDSWEEIAAQLPPIDLETNYRITIHSKPFSHPAISPRIKIRHKYTTPGRRWENLSVSTLTPWDAIKLYLGDEATPELEALFYETI